MVTEPTRLEIDMAKVAGLTPNNEFKTEQVKEHIKKLAVSAVDVSGFATKDAVDSITQRIESGELKGEPGEAVGVYGEANATLADGTLTIDPNYAVVHVPRISGTVSAKIGDVDLPEGVESANGVQVTLMMEGVDEDADISWPAGTITHDKSLTNRHVALLVRTGGHWEVFFPPLSKVSVDDIASGALFSEEYPALYEKRYDSETDSMVDDRIIPIQEQISGAVSDNYGDPVIEYGKFESDRGNRNTISDVLKMLWYRVVARGEELDRLGTTVNYSAERQYDEEEKFLYPDPSNTEKYMAFADTQRPATTVKEIDGVPHLVHWMPRWSENMSKVLSGEMSNEEFSEQASQNEKPHPPYPTYKPHPDDPYSYITIPPPKEEMDKYREDLRNWSNVWEVSPLAWEAYTVPMTRNESLDEKPKSYEGSNFGDDGAV